ncbi:MAG: bifunctional 5,10-methylenetetrahydrofolate dehydrogenase/5,10-methenyltetrahydrofolate cyclohydrolase [Candidatus Moraniibacteriota bacterium]|nr:MAG: bifunctional 5,10-methylenetetrahydrofolate dehydrogenase/5,10-methenyltetrahydrofolate cyclohydrolase [Candidatus Moranbacteria bacterium]
MALLLGKPVAESILADTKDKIDQAEMSPGLAVVLVGDYIESHKYVSLKEERAKEVGIYFEKHLFPTTASPQVVFEIIKTLNACPDIHGIIVQLPLPNGWPTDEIIRAIDPKKDADGFHPETVRQFLLGDESLCPVFPRAVIELLRATGETYQDERAVAIVNSELLGQVFEQALTHEGLRSEYVLSSVGKQVIAQKTIGARVVVSACGIPDLVTADMLSSHAIVIDGGNVHVDGKVRGDVDRAAVADHVAWLSPVPGGVGPVTIACLLRRVMQLALESKAPQ